MVKTKKMINGKKMFKSRKGAQDTISTMLVIFFCLVLAVYIYYQVFEKDKEEGDKLSESTKTSGNAATLQKLCQNWVNSGFASTNEVGDTNKNKFSAFSSHDHLSCCNDLGAVYQKNADPNLETKEDIPDDSFEQCKNACRQLLREHDVCVTQKGEKEAPFCLNEKIGENEAIKCE